MDIQFENTSFKRIAGFYDYAISKCGKVLSVRYNKIISQHENHGGYMCVSLRKNGKHHSQRLHRLLAITFIEKELKDQCVNHIDGNKLNNDLANLEWVTFSVNIQHAFDNGLNYSSDLAKKRTSEVRSKKVLDTKTGIEYDSLLIASKQVGIKMKTLSAILNGQIKNKTNLIYAT